MILYFFPAFIRHVSVISAAFLLLIVNTYSRITESLTAHPQLKTLFQTRKMASPVERLVKQQNGEVPCKGKTNLASDTETTWITAATRLASLAANH
jgi:hypothetical protein